MCISVCACAPACVCHPCENDQEATAGTGDPPFHPHHIAPLQDMRTCLGKIHCRIQPAQITCMNVYMDTWIHTYMLHASCMDEAMHEAQPQPTLLPLLSKIHPSQSHPPANTSYSRDLHRSLPNPNPLHMAMARLSHQLLPYCIPACHYQIALRCTRMSKRSGGYRCYRSSLEISHAISRICLL